MFDFLQSRATGRSVFILLMVTMAVYAWMLLVSIPGVLAQAPELKLFDMSPMGYSVVYAKELLNGIGETGRQAYLSHQLPVDFVYPGLFAVTSAMMLTWVLRKSFEKDSKAFYLALVPVAAAGFDYLENLGIILMLKSYPEVSTAVVITSSIFTILKSLLTVLFCFLLLNSFIAWAILAWSQFRRDGSAD